MSRLRSRHFQRLKLQNHLGALWQAAAFTLILVTHDVDEAVVLSDRVIVTHGQRGRIHREVAIDLPRPRVHSATDVQTLKEDIQALDFS